MNEVLGSNIELNNRSNFLPVVTLLEKPLFPKILATLIIARQEDVRAINSVINNYKGSFIAVLKDEDDESEYKCKKVGILAKVSKYIRLPNGGIHIYATTIERVVIDEYKTENFTLFASYHTLEDKKSSDKTLMPYVRILKDLVTATAKSRIFNFGTEINIANYSNATDICWYAASSLTSAPRDFLQSLLEETDPKKRVRDLTGFITGEKEVIEKEDEIRDNLINKARNRNKEAILREQIKALSSELEEISGDYSYRGTISSSDDIFDRIRETILPDNYKQVVEKEAERLASLDRMNAEYPLTKKYIETILDLPFDTKESTNEVKYSITDVKHQLEKDHYGMKEVKERIVEFLASRLKANNNKGAIICLAGPPGVGKTSVGSSIAKALHRPFYRFSVGGMRDEAEIKGHRRTYIGAMPGKIIQAMMATKSTTPLVLIDEIDKLGVSMQGDPASALLEVLDPEQNSNFKDFYLDLPYDLSKVLFIVTANDLSNIPRPLFDRMEIIEMGGYTPNEKLHIGKEYLVPELMKKNGLDKSEVRLDNKALLKIAEEYARESGVRQYKNLIDKIMRKVALQTLEEKDEIKLPIKVTSKNLSSYLDTPPFPSDEIIKADSVGTAMGLAWTAFGGDVIPVEAISLPQKGELKITGQLGDVMKESVLIAFSSVKHEAYLRGLDISFFEENSVHLHCPEGAVPKDGPSAGITLFCALWSMYRGVATKPYLAMTGELTLTGKVENIGGLKEKILGARRNGIKEIIIPKGNVKDLNKLSDEIKGDVIFHAVKTIEEVLNIAFPNEKSHRLSSEELERITIERKEKEKKSNLTK